MSAPAVLNAAADDEMQSASERAGLKLSVRRSDTLSVNIIASEEHTLLVGCDQGVDGADDRDVVTDAKEFLVECVVDAVGDNVVLAPLREDVDLLESSVQILALRGIARLVEGHVGRVRAHGAFDQARAEITSGCGHGRASKECSDGDRLSEHLEISVAVDKVEKAKRECG